MLIVEEYPQHFSAAATEVTAHGGCQHKKDRLVDRVSGATDVWLRATYHRPKIQGAGVGRDLVCTDTHEIPYRVIECFGFRHRQTKQFGAFAQTGDMPIETEYMQAAVCMPIGLEPLEAGAGVMNYVCGWV